MMVVSCLVACGVCFITLCDSSYPRILAFHYLQELRQELEKLSSEELIEKISRPYSFVKFGKQILIFVSNVYSLHSHHVSYIVNFYEMYHVISMVMKF